MRKAAGMASLDAFGTKKLAVEFFTTNTPNASPLTVFGVSVSVRKTVRKTARRAVLDTFGMKEHAVEFIATDAPNPSALTQNSCLARFWSFAFGTKELCEILPGGPLWTLLVRKNLQLNFSQRTHPIRPV